MSWPTVLPKWLQLWMVVNLLARSSAFLPEALCYCIKSSHLRSLPSRRRSGLVARKTEGARVYFRYRRPWYPRLSGLRMADLYRNDAEADFFAQRLQDLITSYALETANQYWMELRGESSNMYVEWLSRYLKDSGGIESVGWHSFLSEMLRAPPEDIIVRKMVKRPRGGSGTNPYLTARKPVEYKETIEPVTIARRLMEIREQIAEQLSADLRRMAAENQKLEQNYVDEVELGSDRALQLRLTVMEPTQEIDPSSGTADPPQRRATYKSAVDLVTAASLRRVQSELRIRGDRHTLEWLDRFSERELDVRGNALIEALFEGPVVLINDSNRPRQKVIEPVKVARAIMQGRETVSEELIAVLENVPRDHLQMTVLLLNEKWESRGDVEAGEPDIRDS
ncbi:unnamed protein product [Ascophyllum nodosum]